MKDDIYQMTTEMADDRRHWHVMIRAGTLRSVESEGEKNYLDVSNIDQVPDDW